MPGTILAGKYVVGRATSAGGFGIIYRCWDTSLHSVVAIKEFFISRLMSRAVGEKRVIVHHKNQEEFGYRKKRFLSEARNMAIFANKGIIPNVYDFFEENDTAYIVMEFLEGQGLNKYLAEHGGKIDQEFALKIINDVGNALREIHAKGIIHQDIAPDNIYINNAKGIEIKVLDFGAATLHDETDKHVDVVVKPGYSPSEQYEIDPQKKVVGPWTDVYALGATLYVMLTGIRPEESTNRKENHDQVIPPHVLNPEIPENLSNAIMRAMAVERHLRYKTVEEFLQAINGNKKVRTVEQEKRKRRMRRFSGIASAALILLAVGAVILYSYLDRKAEERLADASITVWISVADEGEKSAMEMIVNDFTGDEKFHNVSVTLRSIPEDEYEAEIRKAAESGTLPNLFESSGLPDELLTMAEDVGKVLRSDNARECLFLNQYKSFYSDMKRMPIGMELPVAYLITNSEEGKYVDYEKAYFSSLSDFDTELPIAISERHRELISPFLLSELDYTDQSDFLNNEGNESAVFLSSSMDMGLVNSTLTNYPRAYIYPDGKTVPCAFNYEWSIGKAGREEVRASERLLSWLLGEQYQTLLMISMSDNGEIPLNRESFEEKTAQKNYLPLQEIKNKFRFER